MRRFAALPFLAAAIATGIAAWALHAIDNAVRAIGRTK